MRENKRAQDFTSRNLFISVSLYMSIKRSCMSMSKLQECRRVFKHCYVIVVLNLKKRRCAVNFHNARHDNVR